jgi:hypothetical protein
MLAVVRKLIAGKDDAAALEQRLAALRAEGRDASLAIDALKIERASAASYDEARELDDRIARQIWVTEHAAAEIPQLELQLAAVKEVQRAAALAKHIRALIEVYPRLKRAIFAAVEAQHEAIAVREAAVKELGEHQVARNLPHLAYSGLLLRDLVAIWQAENDRVFADLARKPKPAAIPAPVRAALPAPAKPKARAVVAEPAPRPARVPRHDAFPVDGQGQLVVFLRGGCELPDGSTAGIGDEVTLPAEQARQLVLRGAADYSTRIAAKDEG